ncbi:hypothetical protein [Hyalangium gracile]|uniref:hypothetical protein n=1 Tax=Hyalangium gracile TaxID=394092 RepID=UPI001CC93D11|nr:hypothetical protein [Hyalangium gracile]
MGHYLFRFGYCTPAQWHANETHDWDDESSSAIFVKADSAEAALSWGEAIAERFMQTLFSTAGQTTDSPSWKASNFAHWIEDSPEKSFSPEQLVSIPAVKVGEFPDFTLLLQA